MININITDKQLQEVHEKMGVRTFQVWRILKHEYTNYDQVVISPKNGGVSEELRAQALREVAVGLIRRYAESDIDVSIKRDMLKRVIPLKLKEDLETYQAV